MEKLDEGQALHTSPYVMQIERFAHSLKQLSHTFLQLEEEKKTFTNAEIEEMFEATRDKVCSHCEKCSWCWGENVIRTYQMGYEILGTIEQYGSELNVEMKRKLQKRCVMAPRFLREILDVFHDAKNNLVWQRKMASSREGCAIQMEAFANMIRTESKELEDSIISDSRMEKNIESGLSKIGVKVLYTTILMSAEGKYELYVTARANKGHSVTYKELAGEISRIMGRQMIARNARYGTLGNDYTTTIYMEGPRYYTLQGIARIGKDCDQISGDNFMMIDLAGGRQCIALSDGMGAGESACKESGQVVDLLQELLEAGFPEKTAIQMINTALVMGREEIHFSTIDLCMFYLYSGKCRFLKAGASSTFIKRGTSVEHLCSTSLPVGVVQKMEIDMVERQLDDGDFVIMVTDGIMDALPVGEQEIILETIIQGTNKNNAKEMAHHILEQVLEWNGRAPMDDMTVLVASLWRFV